MTGRGPCQASVFDVAPYGGARRTCGLPEDDEIHHPPRFLHPFSPPPPILDVPMTPGPSGPEAATHSSADGMLYCIEAGRLFYWRRHRWTAASGTPGTLSRLASPPEKV